MIGQKKLLLIGGGVIAALLVVAVIAFSLTRQPAPEVPVTPEEPTVVKDVAPTPPPEPTSWFYPLTGEEAPDEEATLRRTLSVKIENTPEARPQTGLSSADVVYETVTEGGITRFNCLYQSTVPPELGPVRSGRLSDLFIVPQYDALLFFSGANPYVVDQIAAAGLSDMSHGAASSLYYRVDYREMPHNLYLNLADAYTAAADKGFATTVEAPHGLEFAAAVASAAGAGVSGAGAGADAGGTGAAGAAGADTAAGTAAGTGATGTGATGVASEHATASEAQSVTVPLSDSYIAEWSWDEASKTYLRSMGGATIDAATDGQVAANNVVVLWTSYVISVDNLTYYVDLGGTGAASLFIDGKRIDGTWEGSATTPPRFKDSDGNPLLLTPGKTWFQILDNGRDITVSN